MDIYVYETWDTLHVHSCTYMYMEASFPKEQESDVEPLYFRRIYF